MSITEQLGKAGIPGFRSGKWWKMIIATIVYLNLFFAFSAIVAAFVFGMGEPTQRVPESVHTTPVVSTTPTPTITNVPAITPTTPIQTQTAVPIQTQPPKNIIIHYSATKNDAIGQYSTVPKGKTFLIISLSIENQGYKEFSTNPFFFKLIANNIKYDISFYYSFLEDKLDSVDLLDGGSTKGSIAFEVPSNIQDYKLEYGGFRDYNIIYTPK